MKKRLNTTEVMNELRGQSAFFPGRTPEPFQPEQPSPVSQPATPISQQNIDHTAPDTVIPRYHDTKQDTTVSRNHDTTIPVKEEDIIEAVRKAVKQVGKEAATQRLTLEEKQALADIEYNYKRQGIKTSGNEIMRIATNYIVRDYQKNGEQSVLAKVLRKLNS